VPSAARALRLCTNIDTDRGIRQWPTTVAAFVPHDLLDNYAAALYWNRPGAEMYWFHYTSPRAARAIVRDGVFTVGAHQAVGRAGIYVCPYQPGSLTEDELARRLLDGAFAERDRLQAAVVLVADPAIVLISDPDTRDGMLHLADPGSLVQLPDQITGFAQRAGSRWRHSRGCFEPAHLRTLAGDGQP
jgi:hypothetical protein